MEISSLLKPLTLLLYLTQSSEDETFSPTVQPSVVPSSIPTYLPSPTPTRKPTSPTFKPTPKPKPTFIPNYPPTPPPPTRSPTLIPSLTPSLAALYNLMFQTPVYTADLQVGLIIAYYSDTTCSSGLLGSYTLVGCNTEDHANYSWYIYATVLYDITTVISVDPSSVGCISYTDANDGAHTVNQSVSCSSGECTTANAINFGSLTLGSACSFFAKENNVKWNVFCHDYKAQAA